MVAFAVIGLLVMSAGLVSGGTVQMFRSTLYSGENCTGSTAYFMRMPFGCFAQGAGSAKFEWDGENVTSWSYGQRNCAGAASTVVVTPGCHDMPPVGFYEYAIDTLEEAEILKADIYENSLSCDPSAWVSNLYVTLDECVPTMYTPGLWVSASCNGDQLVASYYTSHTCDPATAANTSLDVSSCMALSSSAAFTVAFDWGGHGCTTTTTTVTSSSTSSSTMTETTLTVTVTTVTATTSTATTVTATDTSTTSSTTDLSNEVSGSETRSAGTACLFLLFKFFAALLF
ncbi:unnamed protein product [Symbiodinium natans]|uniref:Uncharacterized protein n=1 Tax=Symbiodinium natans TaxID=878477 RepID=A0A812SMZ5_9DINO|nr:unnamed protein product [Symbiodinium natans]